MQAQSSQCPSFYACPCRPPFCAASERTHIEVLRRAPPVLKLLLAKRLLTDAHVAQLWSLAMGKQHESVEHLVYDIVADLSAALPVPQLERLFARIEQKPFAAYDAQMIACVVRVTLNAFRAHAANPSTSTVASASASAAAAAATSSMAPKAAVSSSVASSSAASSSLSSSSAPGAGSNGTTSTSGSDQKWYGLHTLWLLIQTAEKQVPALPPHVTREALAQVNYRVGSLRETQPAMNH